MIQLHENSIYLVDGRPEEKASIPQNEARKQTMAWQILQAHNTSGDPERLKIRFDAMVSHDITYVGIIQQARASGMKEFPIPYALTNCHNSLCAVGGTINEDDHVFGLSAAKKYGGIYVPANQSVIHSYAREELARCGAMILGSDSHTRYGALGTMAVGEGGPELAKQLLKNTWDVNMPKVVLVYMTGALRRGVGPHDVAISLVKETFASGFVNNCVLEFCGPGIANLPIDFRNGIDVMTTETTCLSSIWETDEITRGFFETHGRPQDYAELHPGKEAWYDKMITIELDKVEPMIALPFHPSNAYPIREFLANAKELLEKVEQDAARRFPKAHVKLTDKLHDGGVWADQGVIAGCSGGLFDNITEAADILRGGSTGNGEFSLNVYPTSVPVSLALTRNGATAQLLEAGAVIKPSFCGPCFGAGDVSANNGLSLRNTGVQLRDEKGKTVYQDFGELLFTHFGVSGPTVLSASAHLKPGKSYSLVLDLKPALDEGKLDARFLRDLEAYANRSMENALADLFPHSIIPVLLRRAGIDPALRANSLTRQQRRALLEETKRFVIPISGTRPVEEAIITRGGVSTKEIDPRTMASKLVHGLYFAGELIDCDAYTGGFNLQIAWATAHAAAQVL